MKKIINLDEIKSGMQLAEKILNKYGHILLGENLIVEEKHIGVLKTWGIKTVAIVEADNTIAITEADILNAKEILTQKLHWVPRNETEQDLINMAVENIIYKKYSS